MSIGYGAFDHDSWRGTIPVKVIWLTNTPPDGCNNAAGTINYVANYSYSFPTKSQHIIYPFLSSIFEVNGIKYVPVSPSERTCDAIDCAYNSSAENITISSTVNNKGISLSLKQVLPYVCYGNPFIKNVTVESDYTGNVPYKAFYGCIGIKTAIIKNVGDIGGEAFYGCTALQTATISNNGHIGVSAFEGSMKGQPATIEISNNYSIISINSLYKVSDLY